MWTKLSEGKFTPVPLTGVSVKVSVINLVAEVQVEQSYWNETFHPIEVVYKFPLTEGMHPLFFFLCTFLML
ncbi:MAG: VIT domain-containing protein [bacterium]